VSRIAIIPARGGSKRIPKKNIKNFNGQPIITYTIQLAIASGLFDEVMVSTDDAETEIIALKHGATVPFKRSEITANDFATLTDVLLEVILKYKALGKNFDSICCILPTAALITLERLNEAYQKFNTNKLNSLIPVVQFGYPIQRCLKIENENLKMREPNYLQSRSQDLEKFYHDSGQFYWIKTEAFLLEKTIFTSNTGYIELHETEAQDVDTHLDWKMLEVKYEYLKTKINI
jgi:pseudaminic acid cytidylyltransferase